MTHKHESQPTIPRRGAELQDWLRRHLNGEVPGPRCNELLGFRLTGIEEGATYWEWPLDNRFLNGVMVVQGGLLASFADACMAYAAVSVLQDDEGIAASDLRINFLKAAKKGTLRGEARVIKRGKRLIYTEATISDEAGDPVARASGTFVIL